jgi:hypothetical protein
VRRTATTCQIRQHSHQPSLGHGKSNDCSWLEFCGWQREGVGGVSNAAQHQRCCCSPCTSSSRLTWCLRPPSRAGDPGPWAAAINVITAVSSHNTMTGVRHPSRRRPATHARSAPGPCRHPSNASQLKVPGAVTASVALEVQGPVQGPRSTTQGSVRRGRLLKRACCSPDEPLLHSATKHMHTVLRRNLHLISPLPSANLPQHARFCRSACCPC